MDGSSHHGDTPSDEEQKDPVNSHPGSSGGAKPRPPWMSQGKASRGGKKRNKKKRRLAQNAVLAEAAEAERDEPTPEGAAPGRGRTAQDDAMIARLRLPLIEARNLLSSRRGSRLDGRHLEQLGAVYQSPFLWSVRCEAADEADLYMIQDSLLYSGNPWKAVVDRMRLAVEFSRFRDLWKVRELLEEAYGLLDSRNARACDMVTAFRPALKHILDSSWLLVRDAAAALRRAPFPDGGAQADFVPYGALDSGQQAAVHGIHALMCPHELRPAQLARKLDAAEGMWIMAEALCLERAAHKSTVMTLPMYERAYSKRPNPVTAVLLALTLLQHGIEHNSDASFRKCAELARSCLTKYPDSPFIQLHCAKLLHTLPPRFRDLRRSHAAFRAAMQLARDWKKVDLLFGQFLLRHVDPDLAIGYLLRASVVYEDAVIPMGLVGMFALLGLL